MRRLFLFAILGAGCTGQSVPIDGETSTTSRPNDTTADEGGADEGTPDLPSAECPPSSHSNCGPLDAESCEANGCGKLLSGFDADGCVRTPCAEDTDCEDGERCFQPSPWGGCAPATDLSCEQGEDACVCSGSNDCDGRYCIPEDAWPGSPASISFCQAQTTQEACDATEPNLLEGGHCAWKESEVVGESTCIGVAVGACVYFKPVEGGCPETCPTDDTVHPYFRQAGGTAAVILHDDCTLQPMGWEPCEYGGVPPAWCWCDCDQP